ncbi:MAG: hypothetical protein MMC23_004263 [Stictis urceolatum]|nr:hypothetical protein [Stictis urceolata]
MPVELRKRKAPAEPAPPPPAKKKTNPVKAAVEKTKAAIGGKKESAANGTAPASAPTAGSAISLEDFGGEIETHDGEKTTLKKLVDASGSGVVLFTYPKASTPGCTNQACLFRDDYTPLTATGLAIYGLSRDSPKANTTFKTKQKLPYSLLCDPSASLINAIGMKKAPSGTIRGVFVVDKFGKVLVADAGGPAATVAAVKKLVVEEGSNSAEQAKEPASESTKMDIDPAPPATELAAPTAAAGTEPVVLSNDAAPAAAPAPTTSEPAAAPEVTTNGAPLSKEDSEKAEVAADVADTAAKLDKSPNLA